MGDPVAIHGPEDVDAKPAVQGLSKDGLQREVPDARAADMTLEEERNIHSRDYGRAPGLADTLVPTLEERVVEKHQPATEHTHGTPIEENPEKEEQEKVGNVPADAKVGGGQLFDAPVDASSAPETDSQPHHARMGKNDADAEEQKVPRARGVLRKHLNAKSGQSSWTVPTPMPKPKYDADCFEDPICDEFWDDIWVACAEHNVGVCGFESRRCLTSSYHSRPSSSVAFSMLYQTTLLLLGSSTRTSLHIMSVCSGQYVNYLPVFS